MRIGIDCRTILNPEGGELAGVGHYTFNLVHQLIEQYPDVEFVLFFDARMSRQSVLQFSQANVRIKFFPFSTYGKFLPIAYSQLLVAASISRARLDIFHAPANIIPLGYRKPSVVTIHDLAIYHHPEWFPSQMFSTRLLVPQSVKQARRIICVSEATKRDVMDVFGIVAEKISVVPEAADTATLPLHDQYDDVRAIYGLPERYVLFVGTLEPRKNIHVLLQAWHRLTTSQPEVVKGVQLVLAGGVGYHGKEILTQIQSLSLTDSIKHLGYIHHNHKVALLQQAAVFVFPSLYEGFGIPVLEAMQLGVPVVASNAGSIPEVAGSAAHLVDPQHIDGFVAGLQRVLTDRAYADDLRQRGKDQAEEFSWHLTAEATMEVYQQAVGDSLDSPEPAE